jgi:lipid-A-disaccharide synthase-like uncharacterized protein
MFGPLTIALWSALILFAGGDAAAHFTHYRYGETVSKSIKDASKRFPVLHWVVGLLGAILIVHLVLP